MSVEFDVHSLCDTYSNGTISSHHDNDSKKWLGRTFVRLESYVLLDDMGLSWLVNYIQR